MCYQNRQDNFYNSGKNKFFPGVLNFGGFPQYKNAPENSGAILSTLRAVIRCNNNQAAGTLTLIIQPAAIINSNASVQNIINYPRLTKKPAANVSSNSSQDGDLILIKKPAATVTGTATIEATLNEFDSDALLFIAANEAAGGTLDDPTKSALNNLFLDLKGIGPNNATTDFWTTQKVRKWWPLVGGVANAHHIDVRASLGSWAGGWTHSGTGAKGNEINTYFSTLLSLQGEANSNWGFGYYGAGYTGGDWMCGIIDYSTTPNGIWAIRNITGSPIEYYNAGRGTGSASVNTGGLEFVGSRIAHGIGDDVHLRWNGTNSSFIGLSTPSGDTIVNMVFGNATDNLGGIYGANDMEYRSMYVTYDITVAEAAIIETIDNAFQTALGRNTY